MTPWPSTQVALEIDPYYKKAHCNLGIALRRKGNVDAAIIQYLIALRIDPAFADAHYNLGVALALRGRAGEAIRHYQAALQSEPDNTDAQNNLAWLLATSADTSLRDGKKAVALARQANELAGGTDPGILDTLAAALAEAGQFNDAKSTAQKALALARTAGQQALVEELTGELKRYEAGLPCRP